MEDLLASTVPPGTVVSGEIYESGPLAAPTHGNVYPEPFIVHPVTPHTYTIILLHGRGSNGPKFGAQFIGTNTSTGKKLPEIFPSAKWIFPTAKKRRAVIFKRIPIHQWFDVYDIDNRSYKEHLQVDGLQETTQMLHGLIEEEVMNGIPRERIVLGGLSQGCAASMYAMLCYDLRLGGYVGMCGWLPYAKYVEDILGTSPDEEDDEDADVFGESDDEEGANPKTKGEIDKDHEEGEGTKGPIVEAISFLRENISFPRVHDKPLVLQTPAFLGHGALDEKVRFNLGEQARDVLNGLGFEVTWKGYDDLGHWYKIPDEIDHISEFLTGVLGPG
ncbi:hypothetical protein TWF281_011620 [Arthrobotrys megalospora]